MYSETDVCDNGQKCIESLYVDIYTLFVILYYFCKKGIFILKCLEKAVAYMYILAHTCQKKMLRRDLNKRYYMIMHKVLCDNRIKVPFT